MRSVRLAAYGLLASVASLSAQQGVILEARTVAAPSFFTWRFADPLGQDTLVVESVSQFALPVSVALVAGRWTFDVEVAVASGRVSLAGGRTLELQGPTDLRLRAVGRLIGDQLLFTGSLNVPTGKTSLGGGDLEALRVLAAPGLGMPVPQLGIGVGGSAGLVYAWEAGAWGLAVGTSFESRGSYSPVEAQIAGVPVATDLNPGNAVRFSLGADRLAGSGRFSMLAAADVFGTDRITVPGPGTTPTEGTYRLGPQFSLDLALDLVPRGFERLTLGAADRLRTAYTGIDGERAAGSSGNTLVAYVEGLTGNGRGVGVYGRVEGRLESGLETDQTITTAAATTARLLLGLVARAGRATFQPYGSVAVGTLDAGPVSTSLRGFGAGLTVTVR